MSAPSLPKSDPLEIKRRQNIVKTGLAATPADDDMVKTNLTFNDPSQRYALVNLANRDLRPKSVSPAFRVLGLFPSVEAATDFGRQLAPQIPGCNIYLVETCKWNLIPQTATKTVQDCTGKVESLLIEYYKNVVLDKLDFDSRRAHNAGTVVEQSVFENPAYPIAVRELERLGVQVESIATELEARQAKEKQHRLEQLQQQIQEGEHEKEADDVDDHVATNSPPAAPAPPVGRVEFNETMLRSDEDYITFLPDNQRFFMFSVMQDDEEPAFCLYGALGSVQECKGFQHFVLKTAAPTHDNNCCDMGRWIYPESILQMDKFGLSTYPLDEQNRIMQWNRASKNRPLSNMPGIDIEADRGMDGHGNIVDLNIEQKEERE